MFYAGTAIHPGENIKFSLDESGEMYINATGNGIAPLWCFGRFQNKSLAANTYSILTPVFESGTDMISGDQFVAPVNGIYIISTTASLVSSLGNISCAFFKNEIDTTSVPENRIGYSQGAGVIGTPSLSVTTYLESEDYVTFHVWSSVEQSSINASGTIIRFTFIKIA